MEMMICVQEKVQRAECEDTRAGLSQPTQLHRFVSLNHHHDHQQGDEDPLPVPGLSGDGHQLLE